MWRFRKVFSFGRMRTTFSKKGIGYSYGFLGFRFGVSPTGNRFVSFGIPGTGLYFIKYFNNLQYLQKNPSHSINSKTTSAGNTPVVSKNIKIEWWKQKDLDKF